MPADQDDPNVLLKKGIKLVTPNPLALRFKADWSAACGVFDSAAAGFRMRREW